MDVVELVEDDQARTIDLWSRAGLVRPWNDPEEDFRQALGTPTSTLLGVFCEHELVGSMMVGFDGHRGWLYYAAVDPAARRRGVASGLVRAGEAWLVERGVRKVQLMVRSGNDDALEFYDAIGYERGDVTLMQKWLIDPAAPGTRR
ncbi:MAG TPA: GNAT family acetyltransferase [Acidimicrobiales bacterium]